MSFDLYKTLDNGIELAIGLERYIREDRNMDDTYTDFYLDSFYSSGKTEITFVYCYNHYEKQHIVEDKMNKEDFYNLAKID